MNTVYTTNTNPNPDSPKEDAMSTPSTQQRRVKVVKPTTPTAQQPEAPKVKEKRAAKVEAPAQPEASAPEAPKVKARRVSPEAKAAAEAVGNAPQPEAKPTGTAKAAKAAKSKEPTSKDLEQLAQNLLVLDSLDDPYGDLTTYLGEPFVGGGPLDPTLDTVTNPRLVLWKEAYRKKVDAPSLPDHHGKFHKFGRYDISMIATTTVDGKRVTALYPLDGDLALGFDAGQFDTDVAVKFEIIPEDPDEFNDFLLRWAKGLAAHGGENLMPETD